MGRTLPPVVVERFDGGIGNTPRNVNDATAYTVTNFDALTHPNKLKPYRDSEDGDDAGGTSQKQNFAVALRTGTTYSLYALGVKSGASTAEVLYKDLTTGGSADLGDNTWTAPSANQSASGAAVFNLFVYYARVNLIFCAKENDVMAFSPSGTAWDERASTDQISFTTISQGLVHSKDDILYIPYDNKIAKNDNGTWNNTALTLPDHYVINSIAEYGNFIAVGATDKSQVGKSIVYLWDRDATLTTLSESIDFGRGELKILEELDGFLIGISLYARSQSRFDNRVIFRAWGSGSRAKPFQEFVLGNESGDDTLLPIAKQVVDNRIHFMMQAKINGTQKEGVWSVGRSQVNPSGFAVFHERTPTNDTALSSGILYNFIYVGDYLFQAYNTSSAFDVSKTSDQTDFTSQTAIFETKKFNFGDSSQEKKLIAATVTFEPLIASPNGTVVLEFRINEETDYTATDRTLFSESTTNAISKSAVKASTGVNFPKFKEIQFRIKSTGNAIITGLKFKVEEVDIDIYK